MLKTTAVALLAGTAGAVMTLTGTTTYSSTFQCSYPVGGAIKVALDPANIWSACVDLTGATSQSPVSVLVDIDGDQQMDTPRGTLQTRLVEVTSKPASCVSRTRVM